MYTWTWDFNLRGSGEEVERFLVSMIREWPTRYEQVADVLGVTFYGNAFGLAGDYTFRMAIDLRSLDAFAGVDRLYKADPNAMRAMNEFRTTRRDLTCRLLKQQHGAEVISATLNRAPHPEFVYTFGVPSSVSLNTLRSANLGGSPHNVYEAVVQSEPQHGFEVWTSFPDLKQLDNVAPVASSVGSGSSRLYSNLRLVDGALVASA